MLPDFTTAFATTHIRQKKKSPTRRLCAILRLPMSKDAVYLQERHRIGPIEIDRRDVADLKASLIHVRHGLVEPPRPFVEMDDWKLHLDTEEFADAAGAPSQHLLLVTLSVDLEKCPTFGEFGEDVIQSRDPDRLLADHRGFRIEGGGRRQLPMKRTE